MRPNVAFQPCHRLRIAITALMFSTLALSTPAPFSDSDGAAHVEQDGGHKVIFAGVSDENQTSAAPSSTNSTFLKDSDEEQVIDSFNPPDFELRILALGASITWGQGSSHGNGYRKYLRDLLRQAGYKVNMVGFKDHGHMKDNQVEAGHRSNNIAAIHEASKLSVKYQPNVILIHAGNFDALENNDLFEDYDGPNGNVSWVGGIFQRYAWPEGFLLIQKIVLADMWVPGFLSASRDSEHRDDLDTCTAEAQVPAPRVDENVALYMATWGAKMRDTRGETEFLI
ncbi:hypothetical protein QBC36DRAFT_387041 [Triangularia setosa]|uniref:SGNH hydrolase-type esterase domain-containing protein n=1 Tax=Triangularia setosa TaxID=2587417 RepID=A0AAN6W9L8_9PEZI|nr:hypothetical protein QBC36DRAFT_387041 [Podospora setosa]